MSGKDETGARAIATIGEFLAYALKIEEDAVERYALLAGQMEVHNNAPLAALFRTLGGYEAKHAEEIRQELAKHEAPDLRAWDYRWHGDESPESADLMRAHYRMTPWHALQLALKAEEGAVAFFARLANEAEDERIAALARDYADEEREHVALVHRELAKHPKPPEGWDDDPDPPNVND